MISSYIKERIRNAIAAVQPTKESETAIWEMANLLHDRYGEDLAVFWSPEKDEIHFEIFYDKNCEVGITVKVWNGHS